ncbi:unnamed protein product [Candidula unifasciata]|uniref:Uncharacterized protein n=1 Tax=Candidula unifasciata TaxID=100452 RepID=A0A8S3ZHI4_9EUPU|nr:unnamed protein product [Candidula unifasciata]
MYLGSKHETTAATSTTPSSITTTAFSTTTTSPATALLPIATQETYLTIERPLSRRQSSPSLVIKELAEQEDIVQELATSLQATKLLHKSASCKSADLDIQNFGEGKQSKKSHRSAWGRVKDIIHTRKDSIKKKPKRAKTGIDSEETSEADMEVLLEDHWASDVFDDGLLGRSTPKSSPLVSRQQSSKRASDSLPGVAGAGPKTSPSRMSGQTATVSPGNVDMATLLAGSVSSEFNKKMQEWEQIRSKKASFRVTTQLCPRCLLNPAQGDHLPPVSTQPCSRCPLNPSLYVSLTLLLVMGVMQVSIVWSQVEREQVKLEKEKQRLEKERLRTLEREAKLEMLKGRLSQVDMDGGLRKPGLIPLAGSLERANKELLDSLQKKELEYAAVQEQVHQVNEKLATVRENHTTEMARFHRELARGSLSGPANLQVEELETTVGDLEDRIHMMENLGETLASSMESAAVSDSRQTVAKEETM